MALACNVVQCSCAKSCDAVLSGEIIALWPLLWLHGLGFQCGAVLSGGAMQGTALSVDIKPHSISCDFECMTSSQNTKHKIWHAQPHPQPNLKANSHDRHPCISSPPMHTAPPIHISHLMHIGTPPCIDQSPSYILSPMHTCPPTCGIAHEELGRVGIKPHLRDKGGG